MSTPALPPILAVPDLDVEKRAAILDLLFEPCTQLHTLSVSTLREKTFGSYDELVATVGGQLTALWESVLKSDREWLEAILNAHPRLGEKRVESEMSRREQAAMGGTDQVSGSRTEEEKKKEMEDLERLNGRYEACFEGLRYVVFVNGRSRRVIMEDMEQRIGRVDIKQERMDAIQAMCEIASDRAKKLVAKS